MPNKPAKMKLMATSVDILNAIRNNATANYRDYVPPADPSQDSIREIGAIIMQYPALQNEFLTALVNRIGRTMITSKMYSNPWAVFKQGTLEFGETIEDIFVNIAKPYEYDPAVAESEVFKREIPDVRAAFYVLNYQKFYKQTIQNDQLRQAFLAWDGVTDLISKIINAMYTSANLDEFLTMKYMLAKNILAGRLKPVLIQQVVPVNMNSIVSTIKGVSNELEFMSDENNAAGVQTYTLKDDQYLIVNSQFDATMDVEVLASAFNMSKAEFMGHRILVDSFGKLNTDRLDQLFKNDPNYTKLSEDDIKTLDAVPAVLVDKNWFMIFDNLYEFTEQYNGQGLYWNYWFHTWKTFAVSPFANGVVFTTTAPGVTSVSINPSTVTTSKGQSVLLSATVETEGFASKAVKYTASPAENVTIDPLGNVSIAPAYAGGESITVTATSVADSEKSGTATITVSDAG